MRGSPGKVVTYRLTNNYKPNLNWRWELLTWSVDHILNFSNLNFLTFFNKTILITYEFWQIPAIIKSIQQTYHLKIAKTTLSWLFGSFKYAFLWVLMDPSWPGNIAES